MNMKEYYGLIRWYNEVVVSSTVPSIYAKMHKTIIDSRKSIHTKNKELVNYLSVLKELLKNNNLLGLNIEQSKKVFDLGLSSYITTSTISIIDSLFKGESVIGTELQAFISEGHKMLTEIANDFTRVKPVLEKHLTNEISDLPTKNMIEVHFKEQSDIKNYQDLLDQTKTLNLVFHGIMACYDANNSDLDIVGVQKGSLKFLLAIPIVGVVKMLSSIVNELVSTATNLIELRTAIQALRNVKSDEAVRIAEADLLERKIKNIESITERIVREYEIKVDLTSAITKSVQSVDKLLSCGTGIKFINLDAESLKLSNEEVNSILETNKKMEMIFYSNKKLLEGSLVNKELNSKKGIEE